jgi:hypothetical protein
MPSFPERHFKIFFWILKINFIVVTASDLPGNITQEEQQLRLTR